jgi:hypothetical protein
VVASRSVRERRFPTQRCPCRASSAPTPVATNLDEFAERVEQALRAEPVAHFDETGIRVEGRNSWLRVACMPQLTTYLPHRQRGGEAMDDFEILTRFRGVAVHDGLMSYQDFGRKHARCNAHNLREPVAAGEAHPEHTWPHERDQDSRSTQHRCPYRARRRSGRDPCDRGASKAKPGTAGASA